MAGDGGGIGFNRSRCSLELGNHLVSVGYVVLADEQVNLVTVR